MNLLKKAADLNYFCAHYSNSTLKLKVLFDLQYEMSKVKQCYQCINEMAQNRKVVLTIKEKVEIIIHLIGDIESA